MTIGQLNFEGKEITAVKLDIPGLGEQDMGELGLTEVPLEGDRIRVELEMVFGAPTNGSKKPDSFTGFTATPAIRAQKAFIVGNSVQIKGFLKAADVENLWQDSHGAASA